MIPILAAFPFVVPVLWVIWIPVNELRPLQHGPDLPVVHGQGNERAGLCRGLHGWHPHCLLLAWVECRPSAAGPWPPSGIQPQIAPWEVFFASSRGFPGSYGECNRPGSLPPEAGSYWELPMHQKLREFLEMINYHQQFIPQATALQAPWMTSLRASRRIPPSPWTQGRMWSAPSWLSSAS